MALTDAHNTINEIWHFLKTFYEFEDTDEYWSRLHATANELSGKSILMDMFILCCVEDIEKRFYASIGEPRSEKKMLKRIYEMLVKKYE